MNSYTYFSKKNTYFSIIFEKKKKKNLLENFNHRLNIRFFLRLRKINHFVYILIIKNKIILLLRINIHYLTSTNCKIKLSKLIFLRNLIYEKLTI